MRDTLRMIPWSGHIVCDKRGSLLYCEFADRDGIPQGEDLEFCLIHWPTHSYSKCLLSIHSSLGAGDKTANQT